ncbi:MAG: hypothetical protein IJY26_03985 [Clostridia bacterium]|nr:hypothetical protein [Clostridia bacterium]
MRSAYISFNNGKKFFLEIAFMFGVGAIFIAVIAVSFATFFIGVEEFSVNRTFYFLVLDAKEETVDVLSQDAYVGGGAGYAFTYKSAHYVALASYPSETQAKTVQDTLEKKGTQTKILPLELNTLYFTTKAQRENKAQIEGCVNTLLQCITLLYNTANGVDTVQYTQREARAIINELQAVFKELRQNSPPQTESLLGGAERKCREITVGIVYAKDIRYLQLFLSEGLYNLQTVFDN